MFPEYYRRVSSLRPGEMEIVMFRCRWSKVTTGITNPIIHFKNNVVYITFDYHNICFMQCTRNSCILHNVPIDLETLPEKVEIRNRLIVRPVVRSISKIFQNYF